MTIEIILKEIFDALRAIGIPISEKAASRITLILAGLVVLTAVVESVKLLLPLVTRVRNFLSRRFYSQADKDFVEVRSLVVQHLIYEVQRLNREADWNDFRYTALEAEVEVDPALDTFTQRSNRVLGWLRTIWASLKGMIVSPAARPAKDLVHAIMRSTSRVFLIIGDPGSGKTVSLRHLFLRMAEKSVNSKDKSAAIPLYLNLKQLNIPPDDISANAIRGWVIEQLQAGQDRTIFNFLEDHFETILADGNFFFIFDSFDEIPAVMDAYEEGELVRQYAKALDDFLHGPHRCRGLVCSRPYRAPKIFMGQRMTILPLSPKRVKRALERYLIRKRQLAQRAWHELVRERDDLLQVIRTPFYLALLARYVETEEQLPEHHYELFEEFVTTRATADEERLAAFALTPDELLARASRLAFAMTDTPNVGLETTLPQTQEMWTDWGSRQVQLLVDALHYSKLGRVSPKVAGEPQTFSFAHRRFQEYFAARYLRQHPATAPFEELAADNRWREVLVLLCEVLPTDQLDRIIDFSRSVLAAGIDAPSGADEHRQAIETLRFLKDGFHSRLEDVPHDVRILAARLIERQFEIKTVEDRLSSHVEDSPNDVRTLIQIIKGHLASETLRNSLVNDPPGDIVALVQRIKSQLADEDSKGRSLIKHLEKGPTNTKKLLQLLKKQLAKANILDQKRAVESIILADEQSAPALLETALNSESDWVQETALRSCRVLATPSEKILRAIRRRLRRKYINLELFRDFSLYRVLFSSPAPLAPLLYYMWMLGICGLLTAALYVSFGLSCLMTGAVRMFAVLSGVLFAVYSLVSEHQITKDQRVWLFFALLPYYAIASGTSYPPITYTSVLIVSFIVIYLNGFVAYLASNYPAALGDCVLLPFKVVIAIPKRIVRAIENTARKRGWKSLIWSIAKIVVLIGVGFGILVGIGYVLVETYEAIKSCNYSLRCLYTTYHPVVATLLALVEVVGFPILFLGIFSPWIGTLWSAIRDPTLLRYLSLNRSARPVSAIEAVERLRTFSIDSAKIQYIRALSNWLPISSEWHILIEEANKHKGAVRDELYKLAELWQDSEMGN
jgi:hypothetical protein